MRLSPDGGLSGCFSSSPAMAAAAACSPGARYALRQNDCEVRICRRDKLFALFLRCLTWKRLPQRNAAVCADADARRARYRSTGSSSPFREVGIVVASEICYRLGSSLSLENRALLVLAFLSRNQIAVCACWLVHHRASLALGFGGTRSVAALTEEEPCPSASSFDPFFTSRLSSWDTSSRH